MGDDFTLDDEDRWADARVRDVAAMSDDECRGMLRRLAGWMSHDGDRREVWADEHWSSTTH